jgi:hypothetical protein
MTVTSISTPLAQVAPPRNDAAAEEAIISANEIKRILYLAVRGGVDKPPEAEDHAVDTYA